LIDNIVLYREKIQRIVVIEIMKDLHESHASGDEVMAGELFHPGRPTVTDRPWQVEVRSN
jgi:hypothetical protein